MNIQISPNFRILTLRTLFSIMLFILVYALILVTVTMVSIVVLFGAIGTLDDPSFGASIIIAGLFVFFTFIMLFMIKFLFKEHKTDISHLTLVKKVDEPELFLLIHDIVREVGTGFPKKVYLSGEVNAGVFYDSGFWSMFLPVRKNLQIGMGLVNSITRQELKAILAHEFAHFSQKSMKLGSYVYYVNQVIYNMLVDNVSFNESIESWKKMNVVIGLFVRAAEKVIRGIQWILAKMYDVVNLSYMALSREMEFHADEVAAHVAGSDALKDALLRIDLAEHAMNTTLGFYTDKIPENIKSANLFADQSLVMEFMAKQSHLEMRYGLPVVTESDTNKYNRSKLQIRNQWASHPALSDRISRLNSLNIVKADVKNDKAFTAFNFTEKLQQEITEKIFSKVEYADSPVSMNTGEFSKEFMAVVAKNTFDPIYNEYYDNKNPNVFDPAEAIADTDDIELESLFSKEKVDMVYDFLGLDYDKNILSAIAKGEVQIATFDYDGEKYKKREAEGLAQRLDVELQKVREEITRNDIRIFRYFYLQARLHQKEKELVERYVEYFDRDRRFDAGIELYNELHGSMAFVNAVTPFDQIEANFIKIKEKEEKLRSEMKTYLDDEMRKEVPKILIDNCDEYLSQNWIYFRDKSYDENALQKLLTALEDYKFLLWKCIYLSKHKLLAYQRNLLPDTEK